MTIKKAQKERMLDYLIEKLLPSHPDVKGIQNDTVIPGLPVNYIDVNPNSIIILVDQLFKNNTLEKFATAAMREKENIAFVIYKDGKNFFRSAAAMDYSYKANKDLSLKHYQDKMNQVIMLRPEELFISDKRRFNRKNTAELISLLQYYQPQSERLEEGLVNYSFQPVKLDYTHIPSGGFRPENRDSARMYCWDKTKIHTGNLEMKGNYIVEPTSNPLPIQNPGSGRPQQLKLGIC